jgi:hypothetical protein
VTVSVTLTKEHRLVHEENAIERRGQALTWCVFSLAAGGLAPSTSARSSTWRRDRGVASSWPTLDAPRIAKSRRSRQLTPASVRTVAAVDPDASPDE